MTTYRIHTLYTNTHYPIIYILYIYTGRLSQLQHATEEDAAILGHLMIVAGKIAKQEGIADTGYRVVVNDGANAGQTVFHIHLHVIGGKDLVLGWPPYTPVPKVVASTTDNNSSNSGQ